MLYYDQAPEPREESAVRIVREPIRVAALAAMAPRMFGDLVKAVVDVDRGVMAIDGELHADEEAMLLADGSRQAALWGINLRPGSFGSPELVEFDSMINLRPGAGNRSRGVDDPALRDRVIAVVARLVTE